MAHLYFCGGLHASPWSQPRTSARRPFADSAAAAQWSRQCDMHVIIGSCLELRSWCRRLFFGFSCPSHNKTLAACLLTPSLLFDNSGHCPIKTPTWPSDAAALKPVAIRPTEATEVA